MNPQSQETFVPLTAAPAPAKPQEFRVSVLPQPNPETSFQPMAPAPVVSADRKSCEPRVSVERENGRVTHLRIQCSCGQILDMACVYEQPPAGQQ